MRLLLENRDEETTLYLKEAARALCQKFYGQTIFIRGLIEYTNYCKNNCYYCGIRRGNEKAERYRLGKDEILECCTTGYELGFRTFVLQGGEDPFYDDERLCGIVAAIREGYPDCAINLSSGGLRGSGGGWNHRKNSRRFGIFWKLVQYQLW